MLSKLIRALAWLLLGILVVSASYVVFALVAWRDIPVTELEQRYGDTALQQVHVDGVDIRYRLEGQAIGQAPMVVLIHNHFMDMGVWDDWIAVLGEHFSILRYDLTGHGLTGPDPSGQYSVERDVSLLAGLLQALQVDKVSVVGSSLGGNIAFHFAARFAQTTRALVLINSGGLQRPGSRSGREMPAWASFAFRLVPPAGFHKFLRWMVANDSVITEARLQRFSDMFRRSGNRPAEIARLSQFKTGQPDPLLASITAPSLILWGQDNPQLPVTLAPQFKQKLSAADSVELQTYPGAGHVLPLEKPLASASDTRDFLLRQLSP